MATFKQKHFLESFASISKDDVTDNDVAGIVSPYSANNAQSVSMALAGSEDKTKAIFDSIAKLYKKLEYGIRIDSAKYLEDFNRFSTLVKQSLALNNVLSGDDIILSKLADILTYAYTKKNKGKFRIFSDFSTAKLVTQNVFTTSKKLGLVFLPVDMDDIIQKVLLSVLYRPEEMKEKPAKPKEPSKEKETAKL